MIFLMYLYMYIYTNNIIAMLFFSFHLFCVCECVRGKEREKKMLCHGYLNGILPWLTISAHKIPTIILILK